MSAATVIAVSPDAGGHLLRWLGSVRVVEDHPCARGGQLEGDRLADPGGRAGHQGSLAPQECRGRAHEAPLSAGPACAGYRNGRAVRVSSGIIAYCITGITITTRTRGRAHTASPASRGASR